MRTPSLARPDAATETAVKLDAEESPVAQRDADKSSGVKSDVGWFSELAWEVHPDKPGTNLHLTTGVNERLCQKYAAGSVMPSSSFLRGLLRSPLGWEYLDALMEGCTAPWWREVLTAREIAERLRGIVWE